MAPTDSNPPKDRSTPGRQRSAAKRAAILRAATDVFLEDGYARASMDAITARAGVGKQTVYGHFHDKQHLFLAVIDDARSLAGTARDAWAALLSAPGTPVSRLTAFGQELLRIAVEPSIAALRRLVIAEAAHHPELQSMWSVGAPGEAVTRLTDFFSACTQVGELTVDDPRLAAEQFVMLIVGFGMQRTMYGIRELSDEAAHTIAANAASLMARAFRPATPPVS